MSAIASTPEISFRGLEQTAGVLADGFESLLRELDRLVRRENDLRCKLDLAHSAYRELARHPTLVVSDSVIADEVCRQWKASTESPSELMEPPTSLDIVASRHDLGDAFAACKKLKQERRPRQESKSLFTKTSTNWESFEHGLTTPNGISSALECPLVKTTNGDDHNVPTDPIAAEIHDKGSIGSGTAYALQHPNKCPIRYLDQHSPEEVAKYFETHKHEIPRSHAVCISRYQQNDAKIRQLDAKYGNLQDMIQRLGEHHQRFLPSKDDREEQQRRSSQSAGAVVANWTETAIQEEFPEPVTELHQIPGASQGREDGPEQRPSESEKPLREVRVGESPSRPWGISVPLAQEAATSVDLSNKAIEPLSLNRFGGHDASAPDRQQPNDQKPNGQKPNVQRPTRTGPFDGSSTEWPAVDTMPEKQVTTTFSPNGQMIFNGPVFFGYSADQARAMMRSGVLGSGQT